MKTKPKNLRTPLAIAVAAALAGWQPVAYAQEEGADAPGQIEEVVVTGRFISSSQQLVNERMNDAFATDLLGADTIEGGDDNDTIKIGRASCRERV